MNTTINSFDPENCLLHVSHVDIWQYPLHKIYPNAINLLNIDESVRANRFHFAEHRRRFTLGRAMLRVILAQYLPTAAKDLIFTYNQQGKPDVINDLSLQFNLSHSGDMALLAIGKKYPLGIDVEFFSARPYQGIGNILFSANEMLALQQAPAPLKPLIFFTIWAQKEAFIKACGLGLSYPTQTFDVPIFPSKNHAITDTLHQKKWNISSFMPQLACSAALCVHPLVQEIRYLKLTELSMLESNGTKLRKKTDVAWMQRQRNPGSELL